MIDGMICIRCSMVKLVSVSTLVLCWAMFPRVSGVFSRFSGGLWVWVTWVFGLVLCLMLMFFVM